MSAPRRAPRRKIDGVLLLDKPLGMSSNMALQDRADVCSMLKRPATPARSIPLATGLLPLCFGEATKFSSELLDADKAYEATLKLGQTTTTADAEGEVLQTRPVAVTQAALDAALLKFTGPIAIRCRPCIRRSSAMASRCTNMHVPASSWNVRRAMW